MVLDKISINNSYEGRFGSSEVKNFDDIDIDKKFNKINFNISIFNSTYRSDRINYGNIDYNLLGILFMNYDSRNMNNEVVIYNKVIIKNHINLMDII